MPTLDGRDAGYGSVCACGHVYGDHSRGFAGRCRAGESLCTCPHFRWPEVTAPIGHIYGVWPRGVYGGGMPRDLICSTCCRSSANHQGEPPHQRRSYADGSILCAGFTYPGFAPGPVPGAAPPLPPPPPHDYASEPIVGSEDTELRAALQDTLEPL